MSINAPCKDCTKRSYACHDKCAEYKEFKAKTSEMNTAKYKDKEIDGYIRTRSEKIRHRTHTKGVGK